MLHQDFLARGRGRAASHLSRWAQITVPPLARRGVVYLTSSGLAQGMMLLAWLYLPWQLTAEEVGQFALLAFLLELFSRVASLGMDSALLRFYVEVGARPRIFASALACLGAGAGLSLLAVAASWTVVPAVFASLEPVYHRLALLLWAAAVANAVANTILVHHIASNEAGLFGRLNAVRSVMVAGCYVAAATAGLGLAGLLAGQLVAAAVVVAAFYRAQPFAGQTIQPSRPLMRQLVTYSLPMLFYAVFSVVGEYAGRLTLENQVAIATMGVFQFFNQIAMQVNGAWTSINRAWTPHIFQKMDANPTAAFGEITRLSLWGTTVCAAGVVAVMLLERAGLWRHLVPGGYLAQVDLFYVLLLGPLFCCIYTAIYPAFYYAKNTVKISLIQCLVAVVTILLTMALTIKFEAAGAAISWPLGIFLTPLIYAAHFPALRHHIKSSLRILAVWGIAAALMTIALHYYHSTLGAVTALLLGMSVNLLSHRSNPSSPGSGRPTPATA